MSRKNVMRGLQLTIAVLLCGFVLSLGLQNYPASIGLLAAGISFALGGLLLDAYHQAERREVQVRAGGRTVSVVVDGVALSEPVLTEISAYLLQMLNSPEDACRPVAKIVAAGAFTSTALPAAPPAAPVTDTSSKTVKATETTTKSDAASQLLRATPVPVASAPAPVVLDVCDGCQESKQVATVFFDGDPVRLCDACNANQALPTK